MVAIGGSMYCNRCCGSAGPRWFHVVSVCLRGFGHLSKPLFLWAFLNASSFGSLAVAREQMIIVIDRSETYVEVFLSLQARALEEVFSLPPSALIDDSGTVVFDSIRENGSFDIGDEMFRDIAARIGAETVRFEAMSLMLHPLDAPLRLDTPLDGLIAIEVCSVPAEELPGTLNDLQAFAGFIAYTDNPEGALVLGLPKTGRGDVEVEIRDFSGGKRVGTRTAVVTDGGSILMDPSSYKIAGAAQLTWIVLPTLLTLVIASLRRHASGRIAAARD